MTDEVYQQLIELANLHLDGRLTPAQHAELETLLETDAEARRVFADFLHDHAALHYQYAGAVNNQVIDFPTPPSFPTWRWLGIAAAVLALIGVTALLLRPSDGHVATMVSTKAARWESGDLPTADGARLGAGRLRLTQGLATLHFRSGAQIILEAPAELRLVDAMHCALVSGTVVADVPESAHGFRIETPSANVIDHGTRFAVNVDAGKGTTTQVFEGLVEVEQAETRKVVRLEAGQRNQVKGKQLEPVSPSPDEGSWAPVPEIQRTRDWTLLPAARDTYVCNVKTDHTSAVLLLLKHTQEPKGPERRAYLGFDLSQVDRARIAEAELILHLQPTGYGLASVVPDAEFGIYGLLGGENWEEGDLTWANAPANLERAGLEPTRVRKLGSFVVPQGVQTGQFSARTVELAEFLRSDAAAELTTLILVRETPESEGGGLVHGFASHRHPVLPAPTLALRLR